jgi:hypothetical protein
MHTIERDGIDGVDVRLLSTLLRNQPRLRAAWWFLTVTFERKVLRGVFLFGVSWMERGP